MLKRDEFHVDFLVSCSGFADIESNIEELMKNKKNPNWYFWVLVANDAVCLEDKIKVV